MCLYKILPPKGHNGILSLLEYEQSREQMFPRKAINNIGYCLIKLCRQSFAMMLDMDDGSRILPKVFNSSAASSGYKNKCFLQ